MRNTYRKTFASNDEVTKYEGAVMCMFKRTCMERNYN